MIRQHLPVAGKTEQDTRTSMIRGVLISRRQSERGAGDNMLLGAKRFPAMSFVRAAPSELVVYTQLKLVLTLLC
jgi:hypothetical protein